MKKAIGIYINIGLFLWLMMLAPLALAGMNPLLWLACTGIIVILILVWLETLFKYRLSDIKRE